MATLIIVEDDHLIRKSIQMLLELEGYEIHGAENGQEALTLLERCRTSKTPCLILLDLMMPVMDGAEFRRRQLEDPELRDVPVVIITGKGDLRDLAELRPLSVIRKPFKPDVILTLLREHCPLKR
ncbi:MAG: response regulator [Alphaproteobacteria bacterium]|nr:response regulator [Alphaproteobacteria bacterium]